MDKNKFLILPFVAVLVVSLIFLSAQIPSAKVSPKNVPVAIVNEDSGSMGEMIQGMLLQNAPEAVKLIPYDSVEAMQEGMKQRETYAGLVIPANYSAQIQSLQTEAPEAAVLNIHINEGANATVAATMETNLKGIAAGISANVSAQIMQGLQGAGVPISADKVTLLANPVTTNIVKENAVGKLGSVPSALFVPVWISSLLGAIMLYFAGNKRSFKDRKELLSFQLIQSVIPIIYGFFVGYVVTWYSTWVLGYEFDSINNVAILMSLAVISFVYMILSLVSWLKLPIIAVFALLMFFGLPLIQLIPEMLPSFYSDYILPWLPFRYLTEAFKELLYFGEGVINTYSGVLLGIAIGGIILLWFKNLLIKPSNS